MLRSVSLKGAALRALTKEILVPLGDQAGCVSENGLLVSCLRPVPSAFITQISGSVLPSTSKALATKAILVPSGDQAGSLSTTGVLVSRRDPDPSVFIPPMPITWMSLPELLKAIFTPSGEKAGSELPPVGNVILVLPIPSVLMV